MSIDGYSYESDDDDDEEDDDDDDEDGDNDDNDHGHSLTSIAEKGGILPLKRINNKIHSKPGDPHSANNSSNDNKSFKSSLQPNSNDFNEKASGNSVTNVDKISDKISEKLTRGSKYNIVVGKSAKYESLYGSDTDDLYLGQNADNDEAMAAVSSSSSTAALINNGGKSIGLSYAEGIDFESDHGLISGFVFGSGRHNK